jgi:2-polyprenyl-3-methyl-5-hydroxy-6-metoxy-1,4-benzoquinol methylase
MELASNFLRYFKNMLQIATKVDELHRHAPVAEQRIQAKLQSLQTSVESLQMNVALLEQKVGRSQFEILGNEDRQRDIIKILRNEYNLYPTSATMSTEHSIADYSDDHKFPRGTRNDNTRHPRFVRACEMAFGRKVRHLDLGCAGGGLVFDFLIEGNESYGVDGSDYSLLERRAEWRVIPDHLFTADITEPFRILRPDGIVMSFDVITAWEVLEHIPEHRLQNLIDNIWNSLQPGGLFVGSVSTEEDFDRNIAAVWHVTVRPSEWWHLIFRDRRFQRQDDCFTFRDFARGIGNPRLPGELDASRFPDRGFHLVYRKPALEAL